MGKPVLDIGFGYLSKGDLDPSISAALTTAGIQQQHDRVGSTMTEALAHMLTGIAVASTVLR